jgi:nucleoside-diphosphate-sugar epimerase
MQHHPQKKSISIIGAGWLGLACAQQLVTSGHSVKGSSRSAATLEALTAMGAQAFRIDLPQTVQNAQDFFRQCEVLIITLPPGGRQHGSATAQMYLAKLTALLPYLKGANAPSVIYTSSTGVYGSVLGEIDESSAPTPDTNSSTAVAAAERLLQEHVASLTILRLAGLVGPGRHPGRFYGGRDRVITQSDAPLNLVHREDVIRAIELVIDRDLWGMTLNVCAADHPKKGKFYQTAAEALGLSVAGLLPGGGEGKVIRSTKIRQLGWLPKYDQAPDLLFTEQ